MEAGACEIEGMDISPRMANFAREKFGYDPRIHVEQADFMDVSLPGFAVLVAFNSYQHSLLPSLFLKKAKSLLRPGGCLTVAFPFDRERMNTLSAIMPPGVPRGLLPVVEEIIFWQEFFDIDCVCDNEGLYLISGTAK